MLAINLFTGVVFRFDSEGSYTHGVLYYFVYVFPYYFILYAMGIMAFHFKQFTTSQRISIIAFFALCMAGPLLQMLFFPDVLLSLFTISIGLMICMFTLETPDYQLLMRTMGELYDLRQNLQYEVDRQTERAEHLSSQALKTLAVTIDAKDKYTNGHSVRVAEYARELVKRSGGSAKEQEAIYRIGLLHDIGKIGVPDGIINKPSSLTKEEFEIIKSHPVIGAEILKNISMDMPDIEVGARWHHEKYGGGGYPDGLQGENIPEIARIISVADAYDAMTSKRSYRDVLPQETVRREFVEKSGIQFDPVYAKLMVEMMDEDKDYQMREK
ncbi:MAG: HD-GYP domain-containing protein [Clostridiales bacterium]|nr:HD-GYP domain-containing protein [Clostridiales bacterium]